jgi:hypothetical protein
LKLKAAWILAEFAFFSDRLQQLVALARFNAIATMYTFTLAGA